MKNHFINGTFILTNKVEEEIAKGKDALMNWVQTQLTGVVILDCHADANIMAQYGTIMTWGSGHLRYNSLAKREFADFDNADPFVVAAALQNSAVIVSQEVSAPLSQKSIKIPDVCGQFSVKHIDTFTLLRTFGFTM
jgi:hypothetical protein